MLFRNLKETFKTYSIALISAFAVALFLTLYFLLKNGFSNIDFSNHSIRLFLALIIISMYDIFFSFMICYIMYRLNKYMNNKELKNIMIILLIFSFLFLKIVLIYIGLSESWIIILIIAFLILISYLVLIIKRFSNSR